MRHKLAAFTFYINRMIIMPIIDQASIREWDKILIMAQNNGCVTHIMHELRKKLANIKARVAQTQTLQQQNTPSGTTAAKYIK
jgi:hypothetical protein